VTPSRSRSRLRRTTWSCSATCVTSSTRTQTGDCYVGYDAIQPGGRIAVIDVLPSQEPAVSRSVQVYAAGLMTRTSSGGAHDEGSYGARLEEASFYEIRVSEAVGRHRLRL
jgi:hypothetical protein